LIHDRRFILARAVNIHSYPPKQGKKPEHVIILEFEPGFYQCEIEDKLVIQNRREESILRGPYGAIVSDKYWDKLVRDGCCNCMRTIHKEDSGTILWVGVNKSDPLCADCGSSEAIMESVGLLNEYLETLENSTADKQVSLPDPPVLQPPAVSSEGESIH
jgi:hypothetical protein